MTTEIEAEENVITHGEADRKLRWGGVLENPYVAMIIRCRLRAGGMQRYRLGLLRRHGQLGS